MLAWLTVFGRDVVCSEEHDKTFQVRLDDDRTEATRDYFKLII